MKKIKVLIMLLVLIEIGVNAQTQSGCNGCIQGDGKPHPSPIDRHFIGGESAYRQFIKRDLSLKSDYIFKDDDYVGLNITIDKNGYLTQVKIIERSSCKGCDEEAIRLIKTVTKWKPSCRAKKKECKSASFVALVPFGKGSWIFLD